MVQNSKQLLMEVVTYLADHDIPVWIFGGWAEELQQMIKPRVHKDFDLFYFAKDFKMVDELIENEKLSEILEKRFHHKRAFIYRDVLTELFLVQEDENGLYTDFWHRKKYRWPAEMRQQGVDCNVISIDALKAYRRDYAFVETIRKQLHM